MIMVGGRWAVFGAGLALVALVPAQPVLAQRAAPITVTPPTLLPPPRDNGFRLDIPDAGAITPPAGADNLVVEIGKVHVEGAFAEVSREVAAIVERVRGRKVSLADIYKAASAIEAAHIQAGFVLARVSVPPQDLRTGGDLRIVVTDGFIESIDVSHLPRSVRHPVLSRVRALKQQRHLRLQTIEQALMIASDTPGLKLRSTLARGDQAGGTKLILEGTHDILTGSIGVDNALDPTLGTYGWRANVELNSLFGEGEETYGFVSSGLDPQKMFGASAPVTVFGGGVLMPFDQGRMSLNPEATFTRTFLPATPVSPQSLGRLHRLTLRANTTLLRTRQQQASIGLTVEQIDETNSFPEFATPLQSHDRYIALRLGGSWSNSNAQHTAYGFTFQLSQGLSDIGAITPAQAQASGVPYSRAGSSNGFAHLNLGASFSKALGGSFNLAITGRGQTSFDHALFRAEQFALEGTDGVSAYVGGVTTVDEGLVSRIEIARQIPFGNRAVVASGAPYVFVAGGIGRIVLPSAVEPDHIAAGSAGAGLRLFLGKAGHTLTAEYAHGFSDDRAIRTADRVNVTVRLVI